MLLNLRLWDQCRKEAVNICFYTEYMIDFNEKHTRRNFMKINNGYQGILDRRVGTPMAPVEGTRLVTEEFVDEAYCGLNFGCNFHGNFM